MPNEHGPDLLWSPVARRAAGRPALLGSGNASFWQDICDVLIDPEPDPIAAETVHRWLRDQVEREIDERLRRDRHGHLVAWACRLAPKMLWNLPCTVGPPPPRARRRVLAVLFPHKLARLERQLARFAFSWHMRPVVKEDDPAE